MASVLHFSYINLFYARTGVNPQLLFENLLINVPISLFGTLSCFFLYRYVSCHLRFQCLLVQTSKKSTQKKNRSFSSGMNFWFPSLPKTNRNLGIKNRYSYIPLHSLYSHWRLGWYCFWDSVEDNLPILVLTYTVD